MTVIDIYSGFLGAGKTTLIKKMIAEAYQGEKLVLIENEFGQIGIDSGFLQDSGIQITEMNSGCICCSLVGDFGKALNEVIQTYAPDRIVIEPSGVGKLSDVVAAVKKVTGDTVKLGAATVVADASKVRVYMKNCGEFYNDQVETAQTIILSRTQTTPEKKLQEALALLKEHNENATIITTPWDELSGAQIAQAMAGKATLAETLEEMEHAHHCCGHHHDHEDEHHCCGHDHDHEDEHHCCGHHHDHEDEHHCCGHHHDHEDEHHCCGHHHDHEDEHHCCGHDHDHHHHHADEVFTSWGVETAKKYTISQIETALHCLDHGHCGIVLRAKGIVANADGGWIHFDYVPGEIHVRSGSADIIGKICVIGAQLDETAVAKLFEVAL